jgi:ribosomal protein S18 acetylase RimI-like enzyme
MISPNDNLDILLDYYRNHPCQSLPNAFWKTAEKIEQDRLIINRDPNGEIIFLAIREKSRLLSCWVSKSSRQLIQNEYLRDIQFALVHDICFDIFKSHKFSEQRPFFRILHPGAIPIHHPPADFHYRNVNPNEGLSDVARFINQCYENIKVNETLVQSWLKHPVYDPNLWIWIIDNQAKKLAALGIAEIDHRVPEASLEWIHVNPRYKRRGLGSALVSELLRRVSPNVRFTTISGEVNNPSNLEKLYRRMGFTGSDVWWLLKE